ncbi:MAG: UDP-3-O-(3-hydroxymyristoyl)glucosamine N-acyltransferase [Deltaproteobacteria bacterium]|nr:UDP-3-O-(3-hydroxymyristoyl)glucosamine N-acyltransferase [Deltaproteobacteria bacterium]
MYFRPCNKSLSVKEIAKIVNGEVLGSGEVTVSAICSNDEPVDNAISLYTKSSPKTLERIISSKAIVALFVKKELDTESAKDKLALIIVDDPIAAMSKLVPHLLESVQEERSISKNAEIDPTAEIGKNVHIDPFVYIGPNVKIGDNSTIFAHVSIYSEVEVGSGTTIHSHASIRERTILGNFVTIQNGAVIGSDGFGYYAENNRILPVPQVGKVILEDFVDIGANTCIDRATLGNTKVGLMTKIDNLVQVGHNVTIGQATIICGQAGIAGSAKIGNQVTLGGGAGVADHTTIADGCRFAGRSGALGTYREPGDYAGIPAIPASLWKRQVAALAKLPEILQRFKKFLAK